MAVCISLSVRLRQLTDIGLWPIHAVQTSIMQYAFGVQVFREVFFYLFYFVFSEPLMSNEGSIARVGLRWGGEGGN